MTLHNKMCDRIDDLSINIFTILNVCNNTLIQIGHAMQSLKLILQVRRDRFHPYPTTL